MRHASKIIALAALLLLVFTLGASTTDTEQSEVAPPLPLWEPDWSPIGLSTYDHPMASDSIDLGGDGVQEAIVMGIQSLYMFAPSGDEMALQRLDLGDPFNNSDSPMVGNCLAVGDINGDGLEDLVIGTKGYTVWVFVQNEDGEDLTAISMEPFDPPEEFNHLWLVDHDGDGILDLMIPDRAGKNGWLTVYAGDGEGGFGNPRSVEGIGEITRDGEVDLGSSEPGLWVLTHDGAWFIPTGAYVAEERITFGGKGIAIADFDEDGDTDVAISAVSLRIYWREADKYVEEYHELDSISFW
ncbi:MAG: VCBS repeat-containing protein, partial [Candidatus Atribacteria bacterium]